MGVNEALRLVTWLTAGGGGGMVGGVDLDWVLTSVGESGIVPTFGSALPEKDRKGILIKSTSKTPERGTFIGRVCFCKNA